jgi:hypothetical protein
MCVCVCVCACVCVRVCVCAGARVHAYAQALKGVICVRSCNLAYPACKLYGPYCVICGLSGSTIFHDIIS